LGRSESSFSGVEAGALPFPEFPELIQTLENYKNSNLCWLAGNQDSPSQYFSLEIINRRFHFQKNKFAEIKSE